MEKIQLAAKSVLFLARKLRISRPVECMLMHGAVITYIFIYLKSHRVSCFLVRNFPVLSHKEHIFFRTKYEIKIFIWKV
jgi:hypothetical protein